jgi:hypothetical protein
MIAAPTWHGTLADACDCDACPQCGVSGALTLLTSRARYYACGSCAARWSVSRLAADCHGADGMNVRSHGHGRHQHLTS